MTIGSVKAIALAITLMLCADRVPAAQDRKAPAASDPDRAQAAFQAGRYAEALALARQGADAAPTSARALAVRAGVAEFLGEFDEARSAYDRASALAPDDVELIQRTASFAARVGDYDRAVAQLDRLLALQSTRVRGLFQWAPA
jgi:Tfp pilus assembly protein PilF